MRLVGPFLSASGKLGGVVGSRQRTGEGFRVNRPGSNPRTPSQQLNRNQLGACSSLWRTLDASLRRGWDQLADNVVFHDSDGISFHPSAHYLFTSCQMNLRTVGAAPALTAPPAAPTFPSIGQLLATPVYNQADPPNHVTGWQLMTAATLPATLAQVWRATAPRSFGRTHVRPGEFRVLPALLIPPTYPVLLGPAWLSVFGWLPPAGALSFRLTLVDPSTGFAGVGFECVSAWLPDQYSPISGPELSISFDGQVVSTLPAQTIYIDGTETASS